MSRKYFRLVFFLNLFILLAPFQKLCAFEDIDLEQYELVEKKIQNFQNLDLESDVNCSLTDESFWKKEALNLIKLDELELKSRSKKGIEAEKNMLRNLFIKLAFSRLYLAYLDRMENNNIRIEVPWLSFAANATNVVGKIIQFHYLKYANEETKKVMNPKLKFGRFFFIKKYLAKKGIKNKRMQREISEANFFIFKQFYWQFLSFVKCGAKTTMKITKNNEQRDYYKIWKLVDKGSFKNLKKANKLIIHIEQRKILQKMIYSKKISKIVNFFGILNFLAKVDFKDKNGKKINSFSKFSLKKGHYPQLSSEKLRYKWMIYILKENWEYLELQKKKERSYQDQYYYLKESLDILSLY